MLRHQRRRLEEDCLTAFSSLNVLRFPLSAGGRRSHPASQLEIAAPPWLFSFLNGSRAGQDFHSKHGEKGKNLARIELFPCARWERPRRRGRGFKLARRNDQRQFSMIIEHRLPTLSTGVTLFSLNSNVTADRCWSTQRNGEATGAGALRPPAHVRSPESRCNKTLYN